MVFPHDMQYVMKVTWKSLPIYAMQAAGCARHGDSTLNKSLLIICAACALSTTAFASDIFEIKPGKWKSEVTMQMNIVAHGMTINQPANTSSHDYCVTPEEAKFSPEDFSKKLNETSDQGDMECEVSDVKADHPRLSYTLKCGMQGIDMVMENDFTISDDGKSGTGTGTSSFEGNGMKMNSTIQTTQNYLGAC